MIREYILKEYGAWSILVISYAAGLLAAGRVTAASVIVLATLCFVINSKQAYTLWSRETRPGLSIAIFCIQIIPAASLLAWIFQSLLPQLLPYAAIPVTYLVLILTAGEHKTITELVGFWTLTLASVAACASVGIIDPKIYVATALFFSAGVFKIKLQLRKTIFEKIRMALYALICVAVYIFMELPVAALLPLSENLFFSTTLYNVKLKTTGWIEVIKGIAFALLFSLLY
ncbi:MAG: hypothetical protein JXR79_04280 [Nitrospirae bacterium]|nr:hypothetical protein [Nitrospirota bacterium]